MPLLFRTTAPRITAIAYVNLDKGGLVKGSPQIALDVQPPFNEYHFIDINKAKTDFLTETVSSRENAYIYEGDCNEILINDIFPKVKWSDYRRGSCLLDPYGLHLNQEVIQAAGEMKTIDMFLNFPVAYMNRNVLWRNPEGVDLKDIARMNAFWGDESWRSIAYNNTKNLFGFDMKEDNETIALGFKNRLEKGAGFKHVFDPLPMRNSTGSVVYYLFFASQRQVAIDIIKDVFSKYRAFGV